MIPPANITGVILAGGKGRRMGGLDKGLVEYAGRPLVAHVIERLKPQLGDLLINANRNIDEYRRFGYPVFADRLADYQGPLAGIAAALEAAKTGYVLVVPCDGPNLPADLAGRLSAAILREDAAIAVAHDGRRLQSVYTLMRRSLQPSLLAWIQSGQRRVDAWHASMQIAAADFSDTPEGFFNVNFPWEAG